MNIYRKIYEQTYGSIPKDSEGRTYDIHHIDGDRKNNDPSNLVALSIQEHYDTHYNQKDYKACSIIAIRMKKTIEEISLLNSLGARKRVEEGRSNLTSEFASKVQRKLVEEGRHHMCGDGSFQRELVKRLKTEGKHNTDMIVSCPHCGKSGQLVAMKRWHFDNCKEKHDNL